MSRRVHRDVMVALAVGAALALVVVGLVAAAAWGIHRVTDDEPTGPVAESARCDGAWWRFEVHVVGGAVAGQVTVVDDQSRTWTVRWARGNQDTELAVARRTSVGSVTAPLGDTDDSSDRTARLRPLDDADGDWCRLDVAVS